jgi:excisionase family DNA binding protein
VPARANELHMDGLTIPEVAEALGTSPLEVRTWIEQGRLPATEAGGRWCVAELEVERLARRAPEERGGPGPSADEEIGLRRELSSLQRRIVALEAIGDELADLRQRVEDLEGRLGQGSGPARMRPALTPLFRGPDPEP